MFFSDNKPAADTESLQENPLIRFFQDKNQEDFIRYANEISPSAKELFEGTMNGLLGQLPNDMVNVNLSMNREALQHLLLSSMVTGYLAKSFENRLELEKQYAGTNPEEKIQTEQVLPSEEDDLKGIL